jgi:undecaprenyl-diphosphatase
MIELLQGLENQILFFINGTLTHPWLDAFFVNITDLHKQPIFNLVAIAALLFFSFRKYGKQAWRVVVAMALTIAIGDAVGYRLIKGSVQRPRPYQNETIREKIIQRKDAHGNSFPSNHAINCFGAATILAIAFPAGRYIFYIFAMIIGYSRLYLGVHYPSDVLAGAAIGFLVARTVSKFLLNQLKHFTGPRS